MKDSVLPPNEYTVYILRKTNLNRREIKKLTLPQFWDLYKEVYFQESVDEWRNQHSVASIMAAIYNTIPRKRGAKASQARDFLPSDMPTRNPVNPVEALASKQGVKLPNKELKDR